MSRVFIGIGHGGSDPGAVANGMKESNIALGIGLQLNKLLQAAGVTTQISRTTDIDDELTDKIARCNNFGPDLAIDIHINAGGGEGFEAYHTLGGGTGKTLAQNIENEVVKFTNSRGLKTRAGSSGSDYFGFIRQVSAPSIILEAAFIDNAADFAKINTAAGRARFAKAYRAGILKTLGITADSTVKEAETVESSVVYYEYLKDVPAFAKSTVQALVAGGYLTAKDGSLHLNYDMLRILVICYRLTNR